ncbi:unnamed protein product [[Candida] boidinii]|nr:unnamed protein product [[Candida] boidinii]
MANEHKDLVASDIIDSRQAKQEAERAERDYELFLQELEEDPELRQTINLYKAENDNGHGVEDSEDDIVDENDDVDDDAPQIDIDELLDELDEMNLGE